MKRGLALCFLLVCAACSTACSGYSSKTLTVEGASTIAVPIFDNQTFWRGLEFDLTEAVSNEMRSRSGLQLVKSKDADLILTGNIVEYDRPVLTEGSQDIVKEGSIRAVVHVIIRRRDGSVVRDEILGEHSPFVIARGEQEGSARAEAFEDLAEDIVNLLDRDW